MLNVVELSVLDSQRSGPSDEQLKKDYAEELSRTAGGLTEASRELVLDTLVKHIRMAQADAPDPSQLSVDELVGQQSRSLMHASQELQSLFSGEELQQVNIFMNRLQSNLYMNRSMSDDAQ